MTRFEVCRAPRTKGDGTAQQQLVFKASSIHTSTCAACRRTACRRRRQRTLAADGLQLRIVGSGRKKTLQTSGFSGKWGLGVVCTWGRWCQVVCIQACGNRHAVCQPRLAGVTYILYGVLHLAGCRQRDMHVTTLPRRADQHELRLGGVDHQSPTPRQMLQQRARRRWRRGWPRRQLAGLFIAGIAGTGTKSSRLCHFLAHLGALAYGNTTLSETMVRGVLGFGNHMLSRPAPPDGQALNLRSCLTNMCLARGHGRVRTAQGLPALCRAAQHSLQAVSPCVTSCQAGARTTQQAPLPFLHFNDTAPSM